jgi:hypothetical protein
VATSLTRRGPSAAARAETLVVLVYGLAAVALAGEAAPSRSLARETSRRWSVCSSRRSRSGLVSTGAGLFGWQEAGFKTPVELVVIFEVAAVVAAAFAAAATERGHRLCPEVGP